MEKVTKLTPIISKLGVMIEDWDNINDEDITEQAEKMIVKTARHLVAFADKKSELACNCHKEKSVQEKIIQAVTDSVKKNLPPDVNLTIFTVN